MSKLAIHEAASIGNLEAVLECLKFGEHVDQASEYGHTSLINASVNNHVDIVKALLRAAAKVNLMDVNRETALIAAASNGNHDIVKLLIDAGADLNHRNSQGKTAKEMARRTSNLMTYQLLVDSERRDKQRDMMGGSMRSLRGTTPIKTLDSETSPPRKSRTGLVGGTKLMPMGKEPSSTRTNEDINIREELHKIRYTTRKQTSPPNSSSRPMSGRSAKINAGEIPVPRSGWGDEGTPPGSPPIARDITSVSQSLKKHLALRPTKSDLLGRGLMFGSTESLARRTETREDHQRRRQHVEKRLQCKLLERPEPEVLKLKGILRKPQSPAGDSDDDAPLDKQAVAAQLTKKLDTSLRPTRQQLLDLNIIKESNVSPLLAATGEMLKKRQLEAALSKKLEQRHKDNEIYRQSIIEKAKEDQKRMKKANKGSLLQQITSRMAKRTVSMTDVAGKEESPCASPETQRKLQSKLSFHGEVTVARTYDSESYDRSPVTTRKYTNTERLNIAKELNRFKMYEMAVHDESKEQIHFIRTPQGI